MIELYVKRAGGIWFGVAYTDMQVLATAFTNGQQETLCKLMEMLPFNAAFHVTAEGSAIAEKTISIMKNVYDGKDLAQTVPLSFEKLDLPAYACRVLKTVSQIPVGYVSSYGLIAKVSGGGARAVGNVMAANPFAPLVPCHRVVTSDFRLGGYSGGLAVKFEFLKREHKGYTEPKTISVNGKTLQVFPVEKVFAKLKQMCP